MSDRHNLFTATDINGVEITGNYFQTSGDDGVFLQSFWGSSFTGNIVESSDGTNQLTLIESQGSNIAGNYFEGGSVAAIGINDRCFATSITGNRAQGIANAMIRFTDSGVGSNGITIENNYLDSGHDRVVEFSVGSLANNIHIGQNYSSFTGVPSYGPNYAHKKIVIDDDTAFRVHSKPIVGDLRRENSTIIAGTTGTVVEVGSVRQQMYIYTVDYTDLTGLAATEINATICILPAKTKVISVISDVTVGFAGAEAITSNLGYSGGSQLLANHSIAAAARFGLADADMGTVMTRAAAIQGGHLNSWTDTTDIWARIDSALNFTNLTAGSMTFYITTQRY